MQSYSRYDTNVANPYGRFVHECIRESFLYIFVSHITHLKFLAEDEWTRYVFLRDDGSKLPVIQAEKLGAGSLASTSKIPSAQEQASTASKEKSSTKRRASTQLSTCRDDQNKKRRKNSADSAPVAAESQVETAVEAETESRSSNTNGE